MRATAIDTDLHPHADLVILELLRYVGDDHCTTKAAARRLLAKRHSAAALHHALSKVETAERSSDSPALTRAGDILRAALDT